MHECGKRSQNLFRGTKMCARVDKDELRKADLPVVALRSLSQPLRLYICPQTFLSCRTIAFYLIFPVL